MKLMIYPSSFEASVFLRYATLVKSYDTIFLTGPRGWVFPDGAEMDAEADKKLKTLPSFEESLPLCDDVLFLDTDPALPADILKEKVQAAIDAGKMVYLDNGKSLSGLDFPYGELQRLGNKEPADVSLVKQDVLPIYAIPVPVIFVMGLGANTGKYEIQLSLRRHFLEAGYAVAQVGSRSVSPLFGFDSLPDWVFSAELTGHEKIVLLNRYFYKKCLAEKPDVLIVGIPGGVMPINPLLYEDVGETAFLVCNALRPDLAVLGVYAHTFTQAYFDELRALCKYRFNFNLKHLVVSNTDIMISPETHKSEFTAMPSAIVEGEFLGEKGRFSEVELYNLKKEGDMDHLAAEILQELRDNL